VTGHHAEAIEAACPFPITLRTTRRPMTSVRIGLQALSPKLDAVMAALADQPLINEQDITALIGAFKKRGDASMVVRVASEDGELLPGNPVIRRRAARSLAGGADLACRKWRSRIPSAYRFDTDNRRYRIDIDSPEDLDRFAATTGHTLQRSPTVARRGPMRHRLRGLLRLMLARACARGCSSPAGSALAASRCNWRRRLPADLRCSPLVAGAYAAAAASRAAHATLDTRWRCASLQRPVSPCWRQVAAGVCSPC
jgi:molybdenum cofactor cytidylyltransferase